jgi:hypothetical protein
MVRWTFGRGWLQNQGWYQLTSTNALSKELKIRDERERSLNEDYDYDSDWFIEE